MARPAQTMVAVRALRGREGGGQGGEKGGGRGWGKWE